MERSAPQSFRRGSPAFMSIKWRIIFFNFVTFGKAFWRLRQRLVGVENHIEIESQTHERLSGLELKRNISVLLH